MIVVTCELWPRGDRSRREHLGTAIIANDGTGTPTRGNYTVRLSPRGQPDRVWKVAKVTAFPRRRLLAWDLLLRALQALLGPRNAIVTLGHQTTLKSAEKTFDDMMDEIERNARAKELLEQAERMEGDAELMVHSVSHTECAAGTRLAAANLRARAQELVPPSASKEAA